MPLRFEFPSTTNFRLAFDDLKQFGYEVEESQTEYDMLIVKTEEDDLQAVFDIIGRYGAFKIDYEEDAPDMEDQQIEDYATGKKVSANQRNEEDRQRERDMNVSTPR